MRTLKVRHHRDMKGAIAGRPVAREDVMQGAAHIAPRARQIIEHGTDWNRRARAALAAIFAAPPRRRRGGGNGRAGG